LHGYSSLFYQWGQRHDCKANKAYLVACRHRPYRLVTDDHIGNHADIHEILRGDLIDRNIDVELLTDKTQ